MRLIFAGTPAIAVPGLRRLAAEHEVAAVLTSPDAQAGRGRRESAPAVKQAALELGLPVLQPERLDQAARDLVAAYRPDLLVCVAYGSIFGPRFLALFPQGGINMHPSLLPRWRGPSPLSAAILAGDAESGISVQRLALEMDSGDILAQERFALDGSETAASLAEYAAERGAELLSQTVAALAAGAAVARPQEGEPSFCRLVAKEDGLIDWSADAAAVDRLVRACDPWPRAYSFWQGVALYLAETKPLDGPAGPLPGSVLRVDKSNGILVQTGKGLLAVRRLQLQAKKGMDFLSFANGARGFVGSVLGA